MKELFEPVGLGFRGFLAFGGSGEELIVQECQSNSARQSSLQADAKIWKTACPSVFCTECKGKDSQA